ncbi:MAG TPA: flagellar biosynthesis protein FlhB [Bacillota bacterium]|nr:flagellar biosynthesis protein FlhB [Bacillota bacterium]
MADSRADASLLPSVKFVFDLQFFADEEKTEEATPRKKEEARKKGQVPRSAELNMIITLLASFLIMKALGGHLIQAWINFMKQSLSPGLLNMQIAEGEGAGLFQWNFQFFLQFFLPLGVGVMVIGVLVNFVQSGALFSTEPLRPKWDRINPLQGFKRLFSPRSVVELAKSVLKLGIVGYILWSAMRNEILPWSVKSADLPAVSIAEGYWNLLYQVSIRMIMALLVLAVLDFVYQRWEYRKSLRMTKKEVRDEFKQQEGDPLIKSKIRQRQRQMAMRRMMQDVPKADVIITNPTHFAVALQYDPAKMSSPKVLAKGEDFLAAKIREIATANNVPIVENPPLARALYKAVDIGEFIPADLYQAVAEVLAFVYRLRKKRSRA